MLHFGHFWLTCYSKLPQITFFIGNNPILCYVSGNCTHKLGAQTMKTKLFAAVVSASLFSAGSIFAAGADANGSGTQDYSFVLDGGNSISVTRTTSNPKITGTRADGSEITDAFKTITMTTMEAKWERAGTTIGIRMGRPYGADLAYNEGPVLFDTSATINAQEIGIMAARSIGTNVKVFGGLRLNSFWGSHSIPASGYDYKLEKTSAAGFAIGAAYEIPEIYLRASVQFNSEIKHANTKNTESVTGAVPEMTTSLEMTAPGSTIIKLRSAVTDKIVLFANWRSAQWSKFKITGPVYSGAVGGDIYNPDSGIDYTIGGAMKLSENLTALAGMSRSPKDPDSATESALSPFNGTSTTFFGATLKVRDNIDVTAAIANVSLGDTSVALPTGLAPFAKNTAQRVTIGTTLKF